MQLSRMGTHRGQRHARQFRIKVETRFQKLRRTLPDLPTYHGIETCRESCCCQFVTRFLFCIYPSPSPRPPQPPHFGICRNTIPGTTPSLVILTLNCSTQQETPLLAITHYSRHTLSQFLKLDFSSFVWFTCNSCRRRRLSPSRTRRRLSLRVYAPTRYASSTSSQRPDVRYGCAIRLVAILSTHTLTHGLCLFLSCVHSRNVSSLSLSPAVICINLTHYRIKTCYTPLPGFTLYTLPRLVYTLKIIIPCNNPLYGLVVYIFLRLLPSLLSPFLSFLHSILRSIACPHCRVMLNFTLFTQDRKSVV